MFADILGLKISQAQLWLPLAVGVFAGGLCIVVFRALATRRPALAAPPTPTTRTEQPYDPFVQGSATEQRRAHRRGGNPVEVLLAAEQETTPAWRGWVVDRSVGGLCLCVPQEFDQGTCLRAMPVNAPEFTPWTELEVRSCRSSTEGYEIGCQFLRQPTWSVLLLFG
jgi:hypothetical protein